MRYLRPVPTLAVAVALAFLATPVAEAAMSESAGVDASAARSRILSDTNAARAASGLAPLSPDAALDSVAQGCSQTQAGRRTMAHCDGYDTRYPDGWTWAAENVAAGYAVEAVVDAWMNSPGHRANILNPNTTHLGVGYAVAADGRSYFTQNFAGYPPSVRPPSNDGFFRTAYDGVIWQVSGSSVRAMTYAQWRDAGFPAWRPAATEYVHFPWSSSVSAVTHFGQPSTGWVWQRLDATMWSNAGQPWPRAAGWIAGSTITQWGTSAELVLTDPGGVAHTLTYAEWAATGFQGFQQKANEGFVRLSWDTSGAIAYLCDVSGGRGTRLSYAQWTAAGSPTPQGVARTAGDRVWSADGRSAGGVNYRGPVTETRITPSQWAAMGSPAPSVGPGTVSFGC